jgi:PAS domain S-box-containing protein
LESVIEERLALALEAAGLGTWTWDMASAVTTWDARLEALHGLPPGGFGGTFDDWLAALHPDDRAECLRRVDDAIERRGPYVLLHRTTWPDGSLHWIECRGRVVVDDDGRPAGTIGVALDVTERERRVAVVAAELDEKDDLVSSLQQALLPSVLPSVPGVTVATRYVATRSNIGGDWYAVVPLPGGRLGLGIGDVAGHGLAAVADMAGARFSLRALAMGELDPVPVVTRLNEAVQIFEDDALITALYGIVDPTASTWTFVNAGHCPALVRRPDGSVSVIETKPQPPLGVDAVYVRQSEALDRGSALVLYTDGLVERRREPMGERLRRLAEVVASGPAGAEALADEVLGRLLGDAGNDDDVAVVVATHD